MPNNKEKLKVCPNGFHGNGECSCGEKDNKEKCKTCGRDLHTVKDQRLLCKCHRPAHSTEERNITSEVTHYVDFRMVGSTEEELEVRQNHVIVQERKPKLDSEEPRGESWAEKFDAVWDKDVQPFVNHLKTGLGFFQRPKREMKRLVQDLLSQTKREAEKKVEESVWNDLYSSYPADMENFSTMTESQAYRLLQSFWKKLSALSSRIQEEHE